MSLSEVKIVWCDRKGIDCPDKTAWCGLPDRYPTTAGSSVSEIHDNSNYWRRGDMNTMPDELEINGIKYRKVRE